MTRKPQDPIQRGLLVAAVASALVAGACGGKDEITNASAKTSASATSSASAKPTNGQTGRGGPGGAQFEEIQKCLKAAGLEDKLPTPPKRPSGDKSEVGTPPTDRPSGPPPGADGPGGKGAGTGAAPQNSMGQDPEVQAALKACGIEMPQRPAQGPPQGGAQQAPAS